MSSINVRDKARHMHAMLDRFVTADGSRQDIELAIDDLIQAHRKDQQDCYGCKMADSWTKVCEAIYAATDNLVKRDDLFSAFNVYRDLAAKKIRNENNG